MLFERRSNLNLYLSMNYRHYLQDEAYSFLVKKATEFYNIKNYDKAVLMSFEINKAFNTCFNSDKINLDLELSSGVMFDRTVDTPPFTFYMQCEMTLYDCKSTFKIIDLTECRPSIRHLENEILCTNNLIPRAYKPEDMDKIARIILMKFFPNGLECPQNIPIEGKVTQAVGLNLIDYLSLSTDGTISGQMNFTDDIVNGPAKSVSHL